MHRGGIPPTAASMPPCPTTAGAYTPRRAGAGVSPGHRPHCGGPRAAVAVGAPHIPPPHPPPPLPAVRGR